MVVAELDDKTEDMDSDSEISNPPTDSADVQDASEDIDADNDSNSAQSSNCAELGEFDGVLNAAWVDSISKILKTNKPKGKKTLVLSKAKKICDVKISKLVPAGFQVETETGEVKDEQIEKKIDKEEPETTRRKKKEILSVRKKPNILEKDRERVLAKIATKGVVQLFNAVRMQQKDINEKLDEAGPLEVKRDKALKNIDKKQFLNVLMGKKSESVPEMEEKISKKSGKKEEPSWNVLKNDFMMTAKLKDWDKELEEEMEVE